MLWTTWGLVLVYLLGGIVGGGDCCSLYGAIGSGGNAGVAAIVASLLGTVFTLIRWLGVAGGA